jgi:nicotinamide-nucleotide amidase
MLPGPPHELRPMFLESVVSLINKNFPDAVLYSCRTLRTTGLGESVVEARIAPLLKHFVAEGLDIGYCARPGEVDVRLGARGARELLDRAEAIVRTELQEHVFALEDETLEEAVVRLLTNAKKTLAVAESCTGGLLAHRITNVPGASEVFRGGFVTYSNDAKQKFLGVNESTLTKHGAVSEPVAREMANGARNALVADYALATTGIAGPTAGSEEKPVGTVFIALASQHDTIVIKSLNNFGRDIFKNVTTQQALDLLRRRLLKEK